MRFFVGTYSQRESKGIYTFDLDAATGALTQVAASASVENPSFLARRPGGKVLYSVGEGKAGKVAAYAVAANGGLRLLNVESSGGSAPCYVAVDPAGQHVLVANYMSGSVAVLPTAPDGRVLPLDALVQNAGASHANAGRQEAPHAHMVRVDPTGNFALAADLGCDRVFVFRYDAIAGALKPNEPSAIVAAPGSGPRHFAFTPNGRFAYVIHELNATIAAYACDGAKGAFTELQIVSTLPADWHGANSCAEIVVHPSGRFVYGSNRGHDSLAAFAIDPATGKLISLGFTPSGGRTPRGFAVDPTGVWLVAANQDSDNLAVFRIDAATGALTAMGGEATVPAPVCVVFAQSGHPK